MIEDISSFGDKEEQALLSSNIVARVMNLVTILVDQMESQSTLDLGYKQHLYDLYRKCITALSNLSQSVKHDAR